MHKSPRKIKSHSFYSHLFLYYINVPIFFKFLPFYVDHCRMRDRMRLIARGDFISRTLRLDHTETTTAARFGQDLGFALERKMIEIRRVAHPAHNSASRFSFIQSFIHSFVRKENSWVWIDPVHAPDATGRYGKTCEYPQKSVTTTRKHVRHFRWIKYNPWLDSPQAVDDFRKVQFYMPIFCNGKAHTRCKYEDYFSSVLREILSTLYRFANSSYFNRKM